MKVLLTNDDGIEAEGLQTLRVALAALPEIELVTIAPDGNRSAFARKITTHKPLWIEEIPFDDGSVGFATEGTPVDCVRFATLGLVEGFYPELIVSGINHGANLGDDVTYSGTVAAALEGLLLGIPAIAVSQQSTSREMDFRWGRHFQFDVAAQFAAQLAAHVAQAPLPKGTLVNVNVPGDQPSGVEITRLGKRIYKDQLTLQEEGENGRRRFSIYGEDHGYKDDPGTDLAALAAGKIAVTPLHFDLTYEPGIEALSARDLSQLLEAAAPEAQ
jgi:5'-nucleotidase